MKLADSVETIPLVGGKYALLLSGLGIYRVKDLLEYYPNKYIDSSQIYTFSNLSKDEKRATVGTLQTMVSRKTRSRITIQKATFSSKEGDISVTWFNQPFLVDSLVEGNTYLLLGKLNSKVLYPELLSPEIEELKPDTKHIGRISPVYPLTSGIKTKWLRARIKWLIDKLDYVSDFEDTLDPKLKTEFELIDLKEAISQIHFPQDAESLKKARERIGFDELLDIQIKIEKKRLERMKEESRPINVSRDELGGIINSLNFNLTKDQEEAVDLILREFNNQLPMNHLLQGDVGSGKTIVAVITAFSAIKEGFKVAYLAPTTILSEQIYTVFREVLGIKNIHLVNSKSKLTEPIDKQSIIIGTHALLHLDKSYLDNLNYIIIDEEHRFGVKQREQLSKIEEDYRPHKLSMTATPIPRTLAMTIWGDTSISYIKSKPKNRQTIKTLFTPKKKIDDSHKWIKEQMKATGTQVFWVCPLISESEVVNAKSAEETFEKVKKDFKDFKVRLVHGKTKNKEEEILDFKNNKFDILVTTAIIEVGIDIPNANIIVIESSERFGLAQLHQFRGRVGRSSEQGYCLLYSTESTLTEDQKTRIKYFVEESDGLKLSEFDLKRRGPGEVYGTKQSGIPNLRVADIFNTVLLTKAQKAAKMIVNE